jgi:hypothetical protein
MTKTSRLLAAAALLLAAAPLAAQSADASIEQARQLLTEERFVEALAAATDASRLNATDFRAHYYIAMAQMGLRQFDNAEAEAAVALAQAPEASKPQVLKLQATIRSLRQGTSAVGDAEAALAEGLIGKAARLYEEGWNAGRNAPDMALKAADLYANRLSQPVDAARVLRQVQAAMPGSAAADQADAELKKLAGTLRSIAQAQTNAAAGLGWVEAAPKLAAAEAADPDYAEIYRVRARVAAASGSAELTQAAIKELARRNLVSVAALANLPGLNDFAAQPEFRQFLADAIGVAQAEDVFRRASPAGRLAFLGELAQAGSLQMFFGARRTDQNMFRYYARRQVAALPGIGDCQTSVGFGAMVASSGDVAEFPHVIDWRRTISPLVNSDFVELGPTQSGWQSVGFNVLNGASVAEVVAAVRAIRAACPLPVKRK